MRSTILFITLAVALPAGTADDPRSLVARSIDALGGESALRSIATLQLETMGHEYYIDQSERPEGPYIVRYVSTKEMRDVSHARARAETEAREAMAPDWDAQPALLVDGSAAVQVVKGRAVPASRQTFDAWRARIELAPERLLFVARDAPDLAAAPDERVQGVLQHVLTFGWRGARARLLINACDLVPTALELTHPDPAGIWGQVRETTYYSFWALVAGGVRYPLQSDVTWNGLTKSSTTVVRVTVNPAIDQSALAIPADARSAFAAAPVGPPSLMLDPSRRKDVAPFVAQYAGAWNVEVVRQPDGLVILEAPIGSPYSVQVLDEVAKHYPGVPIKAVVTTSDAWPHMAGLREYVARGIPVYALDLNQPILERLLKADYSAYPDRLAGTPRAPRFTWVSQKTVLGSGDTRVELYPIREENGERMVAAYFPSARLLYTSDEIMHDRNGEFFMPEYLVEVRDVIAREHLAVERIFGMHIGETPWSTIEAAIAKAAGVSRSSSSAGASAAASGASGAGAAR